jgi:hypothetical protein
MKARSTVLGRWILPQPVIERKEYIAIPRFGQNPPYGYAPDPEDPEMLLPVPLELEALEEARKYLKQYSYRKVAAWLSTTTGRYISHNGLYKRIQDEQRHKRRAATYARLKRQYETYLRKAEEYEEKYQRLIGQEATTS